MNPINKGNVISFYFPYLIAQKLQTLILKYKKMATCGTFNKQKMYLVIHHPTGNTGIPFA